jgi:small subunit ribosomal protein S17e
MVRGLLGRASVGKVRIAAVKKVSRELVARYPDKFSKNYEENKVALAVLVDARTKRLRNRIVGYVTRLKIVEAKRAAAPGEIGPEGPDDQA